jgi:hypothetical protein
MKKLALVFGLLVALPVAAAPPPTTKQCKSDKECTAPKHCVKTQGGKSCAQACDPKPGSCPEDQRCVKDGPSYVCRPINDGVDL